MKNFFAIVSSIALAASVWTAPVHAAEKILRYTAIPDQNTTELKEKFAPLSAYLTEKLGVKVEYVPAADYQASVEMFKNGDVLLSWFGGLTGVQARAAIAGSQAIAQGDSDPEYYSLFLAHKDTGIVASESFPEAISNLSFTFGSESSTSGRLMPEYFIKKEAGKSPKDFFSKPVGFSGSHDKTIELIESGRYQAGVVNYKVYEKRVKAGTTNPEVVRVIWKSPKYTDYHWLSHPDLDKTLGAGFTEKLKATLLGITDPKLLLALPRDKLIAANNSDYAKIEDVARELGMLR